MFYPQTLNLSTKEALLLPRLYHANIHANIYILTKFSTSKLSARKPQWENKTIRLSHDEKIEVNEFLRIMKVKYPDLKTDRDVIINWVRGGTLVKELDKHTILNTLNIVRNKLYCSLIIYKDNQFQCGKRVQRSRKFDALSPDPKETLQLCSACKGNAYRILKP